MMWKCHMLLFATNASNRLVFYHKTMWCWRVVQHQIHSAAIGGMHLDNLLIECFVAVGVFLGCKEWGAVVTKLVMFLKIPLNPAPSPPSLEKGPEFV